MYKVDNLIILAQTFYFFQFANLLSGQPLSQYYYGWRWMHGGFFRNFWKYTIPSGYYEESAPESYKLTNLDANFIRNAGFSLSLFAVFLAGWLLISLTIWILSCCNKKEPYYPRIIKQVLFAGI